MISGIYQIVNTVNGRRYIGRAISLTRRWGLHRSALRRGDHDNSHLQRAWNKYGESAFNFLVIGTCQPTDLIRMEQHLLDDVRPEYNISPTAGSNFGTVHSLEARANMSVAAKGKVMSPEARAKIGAANKGKTSNAKEA